MPAGIVAVIEVAEFTTVGIAAPSRVAVAPVKPLPVMLTVEPAAPYGADTKWRFGVARGISQIGGVANWLPGSWTKPVMGRIATSA